MVVAEVGTHNAEILLVGRSESGTGEAVEEAGKTAVFCLLANSIFHLLTSFYPFLL